MLKTHVCASPSMDLWRYINVLLLLFFIIINMFDKHCFAIYSSNKLGGQTPSVCVVFRLTQKRRKILTQN